MSRKGKTTSVLIITILLLLLLIPSGAMIANTILDKAMNAYGQANKINSNLTNPLASQNTLPKKSPCRGYRYCI